MNSVWGLEAAKGKLVRKLPVWDYVYFFATGGGAPVIIPWGQV
jgi:hypothetical protein